MELFPDTYVGLYAVYFN